jgi:hypothetical protein
MVGIADKTIWNCVRDYWRLEIVAAPLQSDRRLISLRGRRRTTEAYSSPLVMDTESLERLSWTFQSAIAVVTGFQATEIRDCRTRFPTRHLLARCHGAFYELEIHGTAVDGDIESVELALSVPKAGSRPLVQLIDADIEVFAADLVEALEVMQDRCAHVNGRRRPS